MTPRSLLAPVRLGGAPLLRAQTDERLVDLARSGSGPALEAIVSRYRGPLLSYSARFLGPERAEDAVQQTFVKAYTALNGGEPVLKLRPWLYRIAHNNSLNMLRDRALLHGPLTDQIDGVDRPEQRDAIVLRALEGKTYEQIAEGLGITDGAVRQLLSRARCGLRAGVAPVTPVGLLARIAAPFGDAPVAVAVGGGGGGGTLAASKLCVPALAAAIAGGGVGGVSERADDRAARDDHASSSSRVPATSARLAMRSTASQARSQGPSDSPSLRLAAPQATRAARAGRAVATGRGARCERAASGRCGPSTRGDVERRTRRGASGPRR